MLVCHKQLSWSVFICSNNMHLVRSIIYAAIDLLVSQFWWERLLFLFVWLDLHAWGIAISSIICPHQTQPTNIALVIALQVRMQRCFPIPDHNTPHILVLASQTSHRPFAISISWQVVRLVCAYGHSWKGGRTGTCPNLEPECADRMGVRFAEHDLSPVDWKFKETRHLTLLIFLT